MRAIAGTLLVAGLSIAGPSLSDVLLHDRTLDAPGAAQSSPSTAITHHQAAGPQLVTVWEQQSGGVREFNVSVATLPLGGSVVDVNLPPAPAGYLWFSDPLVSAPA